MVFTEQQLQVKKLVDVQQDIEIDALNDGVGALSSTMQNGFTEAANNFSDIQNSLESMNLVANDRYNELTGSVNVLSNAMTQGFLDMGNTVINTNDTIQGQFNDVNNYVGGFENNVNTALQGIQSNFYGMENDYLNRFDQVNANISDSINSFNEQITNNLSVKVFSADTMTYNISAAAPVASLTALGYDANGKVIPVTVIANSNLQLPPDANYIYTDMHGIPYAGMADTAVSTNENLITSHAVYNAVNDVMADINEFHNEVDNNLHAVMDGLGITTPMNYISSESPVNYKNVQTVVFAKGTKGNLWSESSLLGNKYYDWNSTTNTLTFSSPTGIIVFNSNMYATFGECSNLNQNISIPNGVTNMAATFDSCSNLNQNILIPDSVTEMQGTFRICESLNQNIRIPNSVTDMFVTFYECTNLNQNIRIPDSVRNMQSTFLNCFSLNQNIRIPNGVTNIVGTFSACLMLNQNIHIPDGITNINSIFGACMSLNQNILVPDSVTDMSYAFGMCTNLNQNILIPGSVTDMSYTFYECTNLNQNIYIYSDKITSMRNTFNSCPLLSDKYIHIRSSIPMDASNSIYNSLVNNVTGVNWTGRVVNDLTAPTTWPPAN